MLSVGTRDDGGKGVRLGFGRRVEMEDDELEEGEACSDREEEEGEDDEDDDHAVDPDIDLSYIDEKIQHVLGQFQKDFEGGVCAGNLGAKFGDYGSFLPAYQRSPSILARPRSPNKSQNFGVARSPHIAQLEAICPNKNTITNSSDALMVNKRISSTQPRNNDSNKPFDPGSSSQRGLNNGSLNGKNSKPLKVRIKVGSENAHSRDNAAIYSGLGLDMSPVSSFEDSPEVNELSPPKHYDSPAVSPRSIYEFYSCLQMSNVVACLLSPLPESMLHLVDKKTQLKTKSKAEEIIPFRDNNNYIGKRKDLTGKNALSEVPYLSEVSNVNPTVSGNNRNGVLENGGTDVSIGKETSSSTQSGLKYIGEKSGRTAVSDGEKVSGVPKRPEKYTGKGSLVPSESMYGELSGYSLGDKPLKAVPEKLPSKNELLFDSCPDVKHLVDDLSNFQNSQVGRPSNKQSSSREVVEEHKGRDHESFKLKPPQKSDINAHGRDRSSDGKLKSSGGKRKHKESSSNVTPLESLKGTSGAVSTLAPKEKKKSLSSKNDLVKSHHNASRPSKEINRSAPREGNMINTHFEEDERGVDRAEAVGERTKQGQEDALIQPAPTEHPKGRKTCKMVKSTPTIADKGSLVTAAVGGFPSSEPVQPLDEWVCCDKCQKWRLLPFGANTAKLPQNWMCSMLDWLPRMNKCSISEEDTTKACKASYEPLPTAGHVPLMGPLDVVQSTACTDTQYHQESGDLPCPGVARKKPILKDALDVPCQPPAAVSADHVKLRQQASVRNRNLNDVKLSAVDSVVLSKSEAMHLNKTLDFSTDNHILKQKEKAHSLDQYPAGGAGDSVGKNHKRSKSKSTAEFNQDGSRTFKKIKVKESKFHDQDSRSNHSFGCKAADDIGYSSKMVSKNHEETSFSSASKLDLRDNIKKDVPAQSIERVKENFCISDQDIPNIPVKRKSLEWQENAGPCGIDFQGEASETIRRKEKKFKLSKSEGRELSVGKGGLKENKGHISARVAPFSFNMDQAPNGAEKHGNIDKLHSQKNSDGLGSLKRESVHPQPSAATSSSSKVSGSRKSKTRFPETRGSPVESVSSSPLRSSAIDNLTTKRNTRRTDDATELDNSLMLSTQRDSAGKINDMHGEFGTKLKVKTKDTLRSGSSDINRTRDSRLLDPAYHSRNKIGNDSTGKASSSLYTKLFGCTDDQPSPSGCDDIDIGTDAFITSEQPYSNTYSHINGRCHDQNEVVSSRHHPNVPQRDAQKKLGKISSSEARVKGTYSTINNRDKTEMITTQQNSCLRVDVNQPDSGFHVSSNIICTDLEDTRNDTYKIGKELKNTPLNIGGQNHYKGKREDLGNSSVVVSKEEANGSYSQATKSKDLHAKASQSTITARKEDCQTEKHSQMTGSKVDKRDYDRLPTERINKSSKGSLERPANAKDKSREFQERVLYNMQVTAKDDMSDAKFAQDVKGYSENHLKQGKKVENQSGSCDSILKHNAKNRLDANSVFRKSPGLCVTSVIREARDLKHTANRIKNDGLQHESTALYFQAALKFLHAASLLESSSSDSAKLGEMTSSIQMYSETAKFCEFCAREYEKQKEMAGAALAYKCMEVAYMKVVYSKHPFAIKDRQELQAAHRIGESPSSSASDVDNVNNQSNTDKVTLDKTMNAQVAGSHVIAARNRPNFVRLLSFAEIVNFAMDASRRSISAFASIHNETDKDEENLLSVRRVLDFNFHDIDGLLRLVRLSMEYINR